MEAIRCTEDRSCSEGRLASQAMLPSTRVATIRLLYGSAALIAIDATPLPDGIIASEKLRRSGI
jgi:hypothetical protein